MAGFGESFANSFNQARNNRAVRERDAFRLAYEDYVNKQESYAKSESAWNNAVAKGETLAKKYGAPQEAALKAAEWYMHGFSDSEVDKMVANSKFSVAPTPELASDINTPEPMDQQMDASGLAPEIPVGAGVINNAVTSPLPDPATQDQTPNPMVDVQPQAKNNNLLGGLLGPDGIFKHAGESDVEKARREVAEQAGVTTEEMQKFEGGFKPPSTSGIDWEYTEPDSEKGTLTPLEQALGEFGLEDGITKATFLAADKAALIWSQSANPKDQERAKRWEALKPSIELALQENVDPEVAKLLTGVNNEHFNLATQKAAAITFADEAAQLAELGGELGGIALTQVGGIVGGYEAFKRELFTGLDLISKMANSGASENDVLAALQADLAKRFTGGADTAAIGRAVSLYSSAFVRLAYSAGKMQGQSGNGFSNFDFEQMVKGLQSSSNFETFNANLQNFANESINKVNTIIDTYRTVPVNLFLMQNEATAPFMGKLLSPVVLTERATKWLTPEEEETFTIGEIRYDGKGNPWMYKGGDPKEQNNWAPYNAAGR